jgi:hypothetical protein
VPTNIFEKLGGLTLPAVLVLILVAVNIVLSLGNQSLREAVDERQQLISQSIQLEALNREIVTALAATALKTNDAQLKSLLASQGFTFPASSAPSNKAK